MDSHFGLINLFFILSVLLCATVHVLPHVSGADFASVAAILKIADAVLKQLIALALEASKLYVKDLDPAGRSTTLLTFRLAPIWGAIFIIRLTEDRGIPDDSTGPLPSVSSDLDNKTAVNCDSTVDGALSADDGSESHDTFFPRLEVQELEEEQATLAPAGAPYTNNVSLPVPFVPHPTWDYDEDHLYDVKDVEDRYFAKAGTYRGQVCAWALLERPDVFYKNNGPTLLLTSPDGDVKYPQDMSPYPGESCWADDDEEEW